MFNRTFIFRVLAFFVAVSVAGSAVATDIAVLPEPGVMVGLSESGSLPFIRGIDFDPANPFVMDFIIDPAGHDDVSMDERAKLIRYFMAALTVPDDKLWVNLSPYEGERIIEDALAETEIGEVFLEQDYLLKQLSASLTHPDTELGEKYWSQTQGAQNNDFSKIWIIPDTISVYDKDKLVLVTNLTFKVETEKDYFAKSKNPEFFRQDKQDYVDSGSGENPDNPVNLVKENLLSVIEKDVNEGKNFAPLRQMIYSIVLAQWFKRKFARSLYAFYFDAEKTAGVDVNDPAIRQQVFEHYVESFSKGAYDVTKKERNQGRLIKRRYFSGGLSSSLTDMKRNPGNIANLPDDLIVQSSMLRTMGTVSKRFLRVAAVLTLVVTMAGCDMFVKYASESPDAGEIDAGEIDAGVDAGERNSSSSIDRFFAALIVVLVLSGCDMFVKYASESSDAGEVDAGEIDAGDFDAGPEWTASSDPDWQEITADSADRRPGIYELLVDTPMTINFTEPMILDDYSTFFSVVLPDNSHSVVNIDILGEYVQDGRPWQSSIGWEASGGAPTDIPLNPPYTGETVRIKRLQVRLEDPVKLGGAVVSLEVEFLGVFQKTSSSAATGGIDLVGMIDGIKVYESSSAIAVDPAYVDGIKGLTFSFVGKGELVPVEQILNMSSAVAR